MSRQRQLIARGAPEAGIGADGVTGASWDFVRFPLVHLVFDCVFPFEN
jgi:hypothetical protein